MVSIIKNKLHFLKAVLAVLYFRYPARRVKVIGVTGTDGKTTTSTMIYRIILAAGKKVALVSTVNAYVGSRKIDTGLHVTSPNSWFLQKLIREIANEGYDYLVLEATSHGLDQHLLLGANVSLAVRRGPSQIYSVTDPQIFELLSVAKQMIITSLSGAEEMLAELDSMSYTTDGGKTATR